MKKIFQATFLLLALLLPDVIYAHDFEVDGIYYWNFFGSLNYASVTYRGNRWEGYDDYLYSYSGDVNIPDSVTYNNKTYPVVGIRIGAFYGCNVTSVAIPNSVTSIGSAAFMNCTQLTGIRIPDGVTEIPDRGFSGCSGLTSINIPEAVTYIGQCAFAECNGLTSVHIPAAVSYFDEGIFMSCENLREITVASDNPYYDSRDNCNAIIETEGNILRVGCNGTVIPNSVEVIGVFAFYGQGITSITIPENITAIEPFAFQNCYSLTDVYSYLSDPSVLIDEMAFYLESEDYTGRTLHVPAGTLALYQENVCWYPYFENIVEMGDGPVSDIPGDVDGDGQVGIADIADLIDYLLGNGDTSFIVTNADVDGDSKIGIADVADLIDKLLSGN